MPTPLTTRIALKIRRTVRELSRAEREFSRVWPQIAPIDGWLVESEAKWLFKSAFAMPEGSNIVEIGSYKGRSTCCLSFGCRGTTKHVFAVDTFDGGPDLPHYDSLHDFNLNLQRCQLSQYVQPIKGLSSQLAKAWDRPIHFLFIDASHLYEDVMADFSGFFPHVVPGGLVAFHDVRGDHPGVARAWDETFKPQLTDIGYCETIGFGRKPR